MRDAGGHDGTVRAMDVVPLEDRIAGVDDVIVGEAAAGHLTLDAATLTALRFTAAEFLRRHDDLMRRFEAGEEPRWAVCDGVIAYWPEDLEVHDGFVDGGAETLPVAAAVLAACSERDVVLAGAHALGAAIRSRSPRELDIADLVAADIAESLVFCDLFDGQLGP